MAKISAVVNTLNEENNIAFCLEALKWCDEIIVVDMQSEDRTVEIASNFTDKIYSFERVGYVEPARKFAVEQATGEWILIVDADEMVQYSLAKTLVETASKGDADVVFIPFKNYLMGAWIRHTGWWPDYHPRFFKKDKIQFSDMIHSEFVIDKAANKLYLLPTSPNCIEHFAYRDSEHFIAKLNRYTTVEAMNMLQQGRKFSFFRMCVAGIRGFQVRFFNNQGFRDGIRGFFLSLLMGIYRMVVYIKLWELHENGTVSVQDKYALRKKAIMKEFII